MARRVRIATITGAIEGLEDLKGTFKLEAPREARQLARTVQFGVAQMVRNVIRQNAPKDTRNLEKGIVAVRRRGTPDVPVSEVMATWGKGQKHNAFYWHMVEWGTSKTDAQPFVTPSVEQVRPDLPAIYREQFGKKYERLLARRAKKAAKA